jgi:hypothetical protein
MTVDLVFLIDVIVNTLQGVKHALHECIVTYQKT